MGVATPEMIELAGKFGPLGLMIAYLMWREVRAEKMEAAKIEAEKALAASMALLTEAVRGLR